MRFWRLGTMAVMAAAGLALVGCGTGETSTGGGQTPVTPLEQAVPRTPHSEPAVVGSGTDTGSAARSDGGAQDVDPLDGGVVEFVELALDTIWIETPSATELTCVGNRLRTGLTADGFDRSIDAMAVNLVALDPADRAEAGIIADAYADCVDVVAAWPDETGPELDRCMADAVGSARYEHLVVLEAATRWTSFPDVELWTEMLDWCPTQGRPVLQQEIQSVDTSFGSQDDLNRTWACLEAMTDAELRAALDAVPFLELARHVRGCDAPA